MQGEGAHPDHGGQTRRVLSEVAQRAADIGQRGARRGRLDDRGERPEEGEQSLVGRAVRQSAADPAEPQAQDGGPVVHPALPWLRCHSFLPVGVPSPAGWRSDQGFIS